LPLVAGRTHTALGTAVPRAEFVVPACGGTIRDNALVSVTCRTSAPITLTPAPVVTNGGFSFSGGDGTKMSGHLVAPSQAIGEINLPVCGAISWFASPHQ